MKSSRRLGISTLQDVTVPVENLSGGQRQAVAVARAAAFGSKVVVLDEPTAALGVRESKQVIELVKSLRDRGIPVILISHNMPQVFEVADRIHIQRLGKCAATITPKSHSDDGCGGDHDRSRSRVTVSLYAGGRATHRRAGVEVRATPGREFDPAGDRAGHERTPRRHPPARSRIGSARQRLRPGLPRRTLWAGTG